MPYRIYITGILLLAAILSAGAQNSELEGTQNYLIHTWQTDNGLPENWVSSIRQTRDGYLWIGTRYGGLARFDGVRFVTFTPENTPELKDVQVEHLDVDETGRLWIVMGNESITTFQYGQFHLMREPRAEPRMRAVHVLTLRTNQVLLSSEYTDLLRFDLSHGRNQGEVLPPNDSNMEPDASTFTVGSDGTIWFYTLNQKLARFANDHFEFATNVPGLNGATVAAIAADAKHQIWLATTTQRLLRWNEDHFVDETPTNGPPPVEIGQMSFSGDGGLWVLEKNRLRKFLHGQWVTTAEAPEFQPDSDPLKLTLHGDAQGNAWLISYGRGLWYIKADGGVQLFTEKNGLPSNLLTRWFQDAEGDVWVGSAGNGIARIRESLFHALGPAEGLPGKVVRSVCVDPQGKLWAGTMAGGLAQWNDRQFTPIPLPLPDNVAPENVTVFPGHNGGLWIGTLNQGLMYWRDGTITHRPINWNTIRVLYGDREGRLWVGGLVSLLCLDHGQLINYGQAEGFVDKHAIGAVAEDAVGALWIVTGPGDLWKLDHGTFTRFTPPKEWASVRFSAVLPETNGVVWIGTLGGGLLRFYNGQFTRCQKINGLPDNNISQLLDGEDGYLWAGTYAGIFRASKDDLAAVGAGRAASVPCRVYGHFDGLPSLECSSGFQPACWRAADGQLYFSTANGVVTVNPREFAINHVPPNVIIEEMLVDGKPRPLPATRTVKPVPMKIEPGHHYVQFRFTGLSFAAPDGVRFRVKLEGVDRDWQNPALRLIGYGPLLPGDYRFHVIACNNDGVWNETGDTLAFTVLPYFWQTLWFRIGLGSLTLVILGVAATLIQRQRYRRRLERVERQNEMERERTRIARDLHDELGTSLTQISLLSALANRQKTPLEESKELIQQVRSRAKEMVVALDEIVWAVNPQNDTFAGLVSYFGHFAEEFFRTTDISFRMDIPNQLPALALSAETRHQLFLAFKEAINNVARHSGASQVQLRVEITEAHCVIYVEDNGHGFETPNNPAARRGNGLTNMQRRLDHIGGRTELRSTPNAGTTVVFYVPLKPV